MRMLKFLLVAVVLSLLAGCAAVQLVETGPQTVAKGFRVDTPVAWGRLDAGYRSVWTLDGLPLNQLYFNAAIKDGEHITTRKKQSRSNATGPFFRQGSDASQIQQLVVDYLRESGMVDVQASNLSPARMGDVEGLRFDLSYATSKGLIYRGRVVGAEHQNQLYLIWYVAPSEYYFERDLALAEQVMNSASIVR
jgi:hypothetical protein